MIKKIIIIPLFVVLFASALSCQSLKLGFRVEPTLMFVNDMNESAFRFSPYGMYLSAQFEPVEWLNLEFRPGYLIAGEDYLGTEFGAYVKLKILQPHLYIIVGVNNHSNIASGHNSGGGYSKQILYKGIGIGFQKDSHLSFDVMYYWTSDKNFAYSFVTDWLTYSKIVQKQMNAVVQVGFCLAWDIL
ncbi:MAG: hypothetical protein M1495_10330 [Bacteroidetes bacterium]|nr:hypothetical protein [Bacteroidota bacterium]